MSKHNKNFSIDTERHAKVLEIFDKWQMRGYNTSHHICQAIKLYDAAEEADVIGSVVEDQDD